MRTEGGAYLLPAATHPSRTPRSRLAFFPDISHMGNVETTVSTAGSSESGASTSIRDLIVPAETELLSFVPEDGPYLH